MFGIDKEKLPSHIAIIMDGNGRYAKKHNLLKVKGHELGMVAMKKIVRHSGKIGIDYLTVYAFSTENWKRTEDEIKGILNLLIFFVDKELNELHENNVKVNILGDYSKFPKNVYSRLLKTIEKTKNNTGLIFNIALNYGARDEILRAVKKIKIADDLRAEDITEELFSENLFTKNIPDPDLIIRTSGEKRLSNFFLWQAAYSEFVFVDTLWPDFDEEEYERCIAEYQRRQRRYGGR